MKDGDEYVINGTKQWITNGGEADIYTVIAMTNKAKGARGASAFIVEKGTPGFDFGKKENKMGIRASATRELIFRESMITFAARGLIGDGMRVSAASGDQTNIDTANGSSAECRATCVPILAAADTRYVHSRIKNGTIWLDTDAVSARNCETRGRQLPRRRIP